jgi:hypothetical protein
VQPIFLFLYDNDDRSSQEVRWDKSHLHNKATPKHTPFNMHCVWSDWTNIQQAITTKQPVRWIVLNSSSHEMKGSLAYSAWNGNNNNNSSLVLCHVTASLGRTRGHDPYPKQTTKPRLIIRAREYLHLYLHTYISHFSVKPSSLPLDKNWMSQFRSTEPFIPLTFQFQLWALIIFAPSCCVLSLFTTQETMGLR